MKRTLLLLICILLAAISFAGCQAPSQASDAPAPADKESTPQASADKPAEAPAQEPVTISWACIETENLTADGYQIMIDAFEADNPNIKVELMLFPAAAADQTLKTWLAGGTFPDVCSKAQLLMNVEGIFAEVPDSLLEKFDERYLTESFGAIRTVPSALQGHFVFIYNKNMFKEAGITAVPETWEEFEAVCEQLKAAGITPLITNGTSDYLFTALEWWSVSACPELEAKYSNSNDALLTGKADWADPIVSDSLKKWQSYYQKGYYYEGSASLGYFQSVDEFAQGGSAMMVDGFWHVGNYDTEDFGTFLSPSQKTSKVATSTTNHWGVSEECKNKEAAWTFIDWILCEHPEYYCDNVRAKDAMLGCVKPEYAYEFEMNDQLIAAYELLDADINKFIDTQFDRADAYALPNGFSDFAFRSMQSMLFENKDVDSELANWNEEFQKLLKNS